MVHSLNRGDQHDQGEPSGPLKMIDERLPPKCPSGVFAVKWNSFDVIIKHRIWLSPASEGLFRCSVGYPSCYPVASQNRRSTWLAS